MGARGNVSGSRQRDGGKRDARGTRGGRRRIWAVLLAALVVILVAAAWQPVERALREQGAEAARSAVLRAAAQCCAVEGAYPSTLAHLEEHYGLSVNRDDYVITYEAYASNVTPSVVVVPR